MPSQAAPKRRGKYFGRLFMVSVSLFVVVSYFFVVLLVGFLAKTKWRTSPESYFLANRRLGGLVLLGTMAATNFSAFTVFGVSGAGYRDGYAFFPIMAFGTGFMALTFYIIGKKVREKSEVYKSVTPPELIGNLFGSPWVRSLAALVMIVFTIPYLALQPMAAGYALEELLGIPYRAGCAITTGVVLLYTLRGGLKAIAWTDIIQGVFMLLMLAVLLVLISTRFGGFIEANHRVFNDFPSLFSRPGGTITAAAGGTGERIGGYLPGIWLSYMLLWFFADPMFPQLFQRFNAAKDPRSLNKTMLLYPLVCTMVFFLPVSIGVLGRLVVPDLGAQEADSIIPIILSHISGPAVAALVTTAGLAALMSTMDSQLLTLSSILTRDILSPLRRLAAPSGKSVNPAVKREKRFGGSIAGRISAAVLAGVGLLAAFNPPATLLEIATHTFTGLAVLFPTVLFGLYVEKPSKVAAVTSIIIGEGSLFFFTLGVLTSSPFLPAVWIVAVSFLVYFIVQGIETAFRKKELCQRITRSLKRPYFYGFIILLVLAVDFWNWGNRPVIVFGLPLWVFYFILLSLLQTLLMIVWRKGKGR
jgi:solute:Na+ symporter, SSS family